MFKCFAYGHLVASAVLGAASLVSAATPADEPFPVGVAKVDITPSHPVRMYGYAARKTESEGTASRLMAKALAIGQDAGEGPAVLLAVDCGAVPASIHREVLRRVQARNTLQPERFVLCNSHTHAGPDLEGMASIKDAEREHLESYATQLTNRLEQVVREALAARKPGRLAWTKGRVGFAVNRRVLKDGKWSDFGAVPDAPIDHSLPLLQVTDGDGRLLAVVANYACHNTTLGGDFKQIHGDWAACAQEYIEADHPGAVALITIGCGADANPNPRGTVALCKQHGRALADEVQRRLKEPLLPIRGPVSARATTLTIPYFPRPPLDDLKRRAPQSYSLQAILEKLERGESLPGSETFHITVWAFGSDLAMVFLSDEVVVDYALRLNKELDGRRLWISAYTNQVSNYIVSKRLIAEGGYEVRNSLSGTVSYGQPELVQPPLEERIVAEVHGLVPKKFQSP